MTTSRCWRLQWLIHHKLSTDVLVSRHMGILAPPLLDTPKVPLKVLPSRNSDTLALDPKVCPPMFTPSYSMIEFLLIEPLDTPTPQAQPNAYYGAEQSMPYRPASHSPDPRTQYPGGTQPLSQPLVQQQPPQSDLYQPVHHRPQSTYDSPQELGTSVYDSPVDHPNAANQRPPYPPSGQAPPSAHQQFQQQQQQQQDYSPSVYSPDDPVQLQSASGMPQQPPHQYPQQQQAQQAPYPTSPPHQQAPPSHQPPPVPGAASQPTQYAAFNPAPSAPPTGEYQAYQPSQAGVPASNPASFYR